MPESREKTEEKGRKTSEEIARLEVKLGVLRHIELHPEKVVFGKVVKSFSRAGHHIQLRFHDPVVYKCGNAAK